MRLVEQWGEVVAGLPRDWETASLRLSVEDETQADRAAMILGPAAPGRSGTAFQLAVDRRGRGLGATPEVVRRVFGRLDEEGLRGRLEVADAVTRDDGDERPAAGLAAQWDALAATLPPDWSHLYAEVAIDSSDFVERAALLLAPANPALYGGPRGLRFRCAREVGYGVSPAMARRCMERLDADGITGRARILRVVSDAHPIATQGPVWYIDGRAV